MPLTTASAEIILIDLVALFLVVATVWILWYVLEKISLDEVKDARFFLTFILVIVPFVIYVPHKTDLV
jgi:4-amino-4-deoxy-L-arabinose transferase-like glycosyltransferase